MAAPLASTIFSTGPLDKLIVQDVYSVTSPNPINNPSTSTGGGLASLLQAFRSGPSAITSLASLLTQNLLGVSLTPASLTARITQAIALFGGSSSQLTPSMQASLLSQPGFSTSQYPQIATTVGTAVSTVPTTDIAGVQSIVGLVNTITGNSSLATVMDVGATTAITAVVMQAAITAKIPGVVQALVSNATNATVIAGALKANAVVAIQQADIATVETIVAVVGAGAIQGLVPNAAIKLLENYSLPTGAQASGYAALYTALLSVLNSVQPGWDTVVRNGVPTPSLAPFVNPSADAITLLNSQGAYATQLILAGLYPSQDLVQAAKSQYPYMLVLPKASVSVTTNALPIAA
jgi:hypothetical protein